MVKYYVRTTLERVLDESYVNELGEDFILLIDYEHKPVESFIEQLDVISNSDAVLLEDDLMLCHNFKNRIEEVISKYPNEVINFFTHPWEYFKTGSFNRFSWNQCTYYPKGLSKKISKEMREIYPIMLENKDELNPMYITPNGDIQYGILVSKALEKLGLSHIRYRPCLVQHMDGKSLLSNGDTDRSTLYFIDYLDKLKLDYNNLNSRAMKYLTIMRNRDVEKWKKRNNLWNTTLEQQEKES